MIIPGQFGFNCPSGFREEDLWNLSQSEYIIGPGSQVEYPTGTKNRNFVEDQPRNIPGKFGSNWPCGFGKETWNVKSWQMTDDIRQVMAIVHLDLWSRWTKKIYAIFMYIPSLHSKEYKLYIMAASICLSGLESTLLSNLKNKWNLTRQYSPAPNYHVWKLALVFIHWRQIYLKTCSDKT